MSLKIIRRARLMHPARSVDRANIYQGARSELHWIAYCLRQIPREIVIERGWLDYKVKSSTGGETSRELSLQRANAFPFLHLRFS